jgi:TRAP-type C4-dicarboxylate transport system permease small subunit
MRAIRPGLGALNRASLYIAGVGMVLMTLIIGWQVFSRYILNDSPSWSEPLSIHLMAWFIMLGAAVGVRESVHLGLDIVHYLMKPGVQKVMDLISLGLIVFLVALWLSTACNSAWAHGLQRYPYWVGQEEWTSFR